MSLYDPASESKIDAFEQKYGVTFPTSYRDFLRQHNGGFPEPNVYESRDIYVEVSLLFEVGSEEYDRAIMTFEHAIAQCFIPVGESGGGDYFLMSLATGAVVFWDHEEEGYNCDYRRLPTLATSIGELVESLHGEVYEESEIMRFGRDGVPADLKAFIGTNGLELDSQDDMGFDLVGTATMHDNLELVRHLIKEGARTDGLVFTAAGNSSRRVLDYLLDEVGLDINQPGRGGQSPLDNVILDMEFRDYMISRGARK
ncbi:MAG: SMI1/KNR4 family protein [Myxococcota bacterium]